MYHPLILKTSLYKIAWGTIHLLFKIKIINLGNFEQKKIGNRLCYEYNTKVLYKVLKNKVKIICNSNFSSYI